MAEGEAKGEAKGRIEERLALARKMKSDDMSIELIARYTGLSESEVERL